MDTYQQFIHLSRYAKWLPSENRRETWEETVDRYFAFFSERLGYSKDDPQVADLRNAVLNFEVMPSMRCMMTAGRALARDPICGYNCAYRAVDDVRAFDEILFILMCGTGVGFSVERQYISKLPTIPEALEPSDTVVVVRDSKRGWAEALRELIAMLYAGRVPSWDTSRVRPAGAPLKTMGGRASGPEVLENLFRFIIKTFRQHAGTQLPSIAVHDILCFIGEIVVVGGVRRSAMISLSNLSDARMRTAKSGEWYTVLPYRSMANNSVAYTETPDSGSFLKEWLSLYESKSGERGIFNRNAAKRQAERAGRPLEDSRGVPYEWGTNPCSEIILRSAQFCNLTEVVARPEDTADTLRQKVQWAAVLGTWQATLTDFRYLTKKWKDNCEDERLLGVSITGIADNPLLNGQQGFEATGALLEELKAEARATNVVVSGALGIKPATAVTCVKPSGTVSQLVGAPSGIHPWFARQYIRRVRQDQKDPLTATLIEAGVPWEVDHYRPDHVVFSFPIQAPEGALVADQVSAIEHLELWKLYQDHWCDHKPSVTIQVDEKEWISVGAWVFAHFEEIAGVSFLPKQNHIYTQAPYEEITPAQYEALMEGMPSGIAWGETEDSAEFITASHQSACEGLICELPAQREGVVNS